MNQIKIIVEERFRSICKNESLLQIVVDKNRLVVNRFLAVYRDTDGDYSLEYAKNNDFFMEGAGSEEDLVERVLHLAMAHIVERESQLGDKKKKMAAALCV